MSSHLRSTWSRQTSSARRSEAGKSWKRKTSKKRRSRASPSIYRLSARRSAASSFCTLLMKMRSILFIRGEFFGVFEDEVADPHAVGAI